MLANIVSKLYFYHYSLISSTFFRKLSMSSSFSIACLSVLDSFCWILRHVAPFYLSKTLNVLLPQVSALSYHSNVMPSGPPVNYTSKLCHKYAKKKPEQTAKVNNWGFLTTLLLANYSGL